MKAGKRRFYFSWHMTVMAVLAAALCYPMSYWQWTRYKDKQAYLARVEAQQARGVLSLDDGASTFADLYHASVVVEGVFDFEREMHLINRSHRQQPGVKLVTPLVIGEKAVLVDRGFMPLVYLDSGKDKALRPSGRVSVHGYVRPSQEKAFFLAPPLRVPQEGEWLTRWLRLDVDVMAKQLPYEVLPVFIEASDEPEAGFPLPLERDVVPPSRHLNYTIQWASFGSFALLLSIFLQFRQPKRRIEPVEASGDPE